MPIRGNILEYEWQYNDIIDVFQTSPFYATFLESLFRNLTVNSKYTTLYLMDVNERNTSFSW